MRLAFESEETRVESVICIIRSLKLPTHLEYLVEEVHSNSKGRQLHMPIIGHSNVHA